jgi:adenine-specific DNA-methyltransferase
MNYIGSKQSLLPFLEQSIKQVIGKGPAPVFCDIFAGTGAVGRHFKQLGYEIIANDFQYYSFVLNRHYIGNNKPLNFDKLKMNAEEVCVYLNNLKGTNGFITKNYCAERKYFTKENGARCDAIRTQIEQWKKQDLVTDDEYYFLLATLLESIDKVANTASVYGAYLKEYKKSALKSLQYVPLPLFTDDKDHKIFNKDSNELVKEIETDVLYLDPPYNTRQYCSNYHVLETIAKYDKPQLIGKTGLRVEKNNSKYCSPVAVKEQFEDLIMNAKAKYIFLSYNNEGLLSLEDIKEIMSKRGKYGCFEKQHNRFKADSKRNNKFNSTTVYLHYVIAT